MISLQFDPTSAEEVLVIQRVLPLFTSGTVRQAEGGPEARFWANLRPRLGPESLRPLCVEAARLGSFRSIGELADHMGIAESTVQSWRRNLGRSQPKANAACGTAFNVFDWDANTGRYTVPPKLAEAILATENRNAVKSPKGSTTA